MSDSKQSVAASTMKAIGFVKDGEPAAVYQLADVPMPVVGARDLLIRVLSIATNPVDGKARKMYKPPAGETDEKKWPVRIVGWDGVGIVTSKGAESKSAFKAGDRVYFAGSLFRSGCYAEYVAIDERIVSLAPTKVSNDEAATIPLCSLTVWEAFLEQMGAVIPTTAEELKHNASKSVLIINGAGGVGSIGTQLAKRVLKFGKVIATASRKETEDWCKSQGADLTINHKNPLLPQLKSLGLEFGVDYVLNCGEAEANFTDAITTVGPLGKICFLTGLSKPVDISSLYFKRASVTFELMFTRAITGIEMERQGEILSKVRELVDSGVLTPTMKTRFDFTLAGVLKAAANRGMHKSSIEQLSDAVRDENGVTVGALIRNGVKINDPFLDGTGSCALVEAARRGSKEIVELILGVKDVKVNARDKSKETALHVSCGGGHYECVKLLLAHNPISSATGLPATTASTASSTSTSAVNLTTTSGQTPLMKACYGRHLHTLSIVNLLLASGALVNAQRKDGKTALHLAVSSGSLDVVDALLRAKANPNIASNDGLTPLLLAAWLGSFGLIRELITRGVDHTHSSILKLPGAPAAAGAPTNLSSFKSFSEAAIKSQQNSSGVSGSASVPGVINALSKKLADAIALGLKDAAERKVAVSNAAATSATAAAAATNATASAADSKDDVKAYKWVPPTAAATSTASAATTFKPTGPVPKPIAAASSFDAKAKK